jgi:uncharacterized RDD family membrane protein YckC
LYPPRAVPILSSRRETIGMTNQYEAGAYQAGRYAFDPVRQPELFDGVLSRRIVAFCIDAVLVFVLTLPVVLMLALLGFVTFFLSWLLIGPSIGLVALAYVGLTLGGPASATVGMRFVGVEMRTWSGAPLFPLLAVMHALVFWISVAVLTPLILLVGLFTFRKQLLHDLLLGVVMLNADGLHRVVR